MYVCPCCLSSLSTTVKILSTPLFAENSSAGEKSFVEVFICFFCEMEFKQKCDLQRHQKQCMLRPVGLQPAARSAKNYQPPRFVPPVIKPKPFTDPNKYKRPLKTAYVENLNLLPLAKAQSIKHRQESQSKDIDCEIIEVEEAPTSPKLPTTPRTPRSLMSQLSRDTSPPPKVRQRLDLPLDKDSSDSESISSKSERSDSGYHPRKVTNLLLIDFSSLLGQRVKRHMSKLRFIINRDDSLEDQTQCKDYERFCRTPVKSDSLERLRSRGPGGYQVTYKKTRRLAPKHCHRFSFGRTQRLERYTTILTGLNKRSRKLKRKIKPCSVVLNKLTKAEIKRWTCPRVRKPDMSLSEANIFRWLDGRNNTPSKFPQGPGLLETCACPELQRLLSLKTLPQPNSRQVPHSAPRPVSAGTDAEMTKQRLLLYKTLLRDSASRTAGRNAASSSSTLRTPTTADDDVISISSSDDDCIVEGVTASVEPPAKRGRFSDGAGPPIKLLFRCHLCNEQLTYRENVNTCIKTHFAQKHNVHNIDLIEQLDANGQKVISIVEVPVTTKQQKSSAVAPSSTKPVNPAKATASRGSDAQNNKPNKRDGLKPIGVNASRTVAAKKFYQSAKRSADAGASSSSSTNSKLANLLSAGTSNGRRSPLDRAQSKSMSNKPETKNRPMPQAKASPPPPSKNTGKPAGVDLPGKSNQTKAFSTSRSENASGSSRSSPAGSIRSQTSVTRGRSVGSDKPQAGRPARNTTPVPEKNPQRNPSSRHHQVQTVQRPQRSVLPVKTSACSKDAKDQTTNIKTAARSKTVLPCPKPSKQSTRNGPLSNRHKSGKAK